VNTENIAVYSSDECWRIQVDGLRICEQCPLKDTDKCGGKSIIETHKNSKGYVVNNNGVTEGKIQEQSKKKKKKKKK
jgi:hypothetical protein